MTHTIQEITAKISALPEPMQQEVFDFIEFMQAKVTRQSLPSKHEPALLSKQALAADWYWSNEDEAELKPTKKHRAPPPQFAGQVKELGDVMSSVSATDWGHESVGWDKFANPSKNS